MTQVALVADLGGSRMRGALVDGDGGISHRPVASTFAQKGREDVLARFLSTLDEVASHAERGALVGVGLALASPTDPESGVMYNPPNLPGWDRFSLKPIVEERLCLRCRVANDASLAALAEHVYGAGRGLRHLIYITVSTGIGGGIIVDGKPYSGAQGLAGEIGHMTIDRNGPRCRCGNLGCLEAMASGTAAARMARDRLVAGEASVLLDRCGGDPDKPESTEGGRRVSVLKRQEGASVNLG